MKPGAAYRQFWTKSSVTLFGNSSLLVTLNYSSLIHRNTTRYWISCYALIREVVVCVICGSFNDNTFCILDFHEMLSLVLMTLYSS